MEKTTMEGKAMDFGRAYETPCALGTLPLTVERSLLNGSVVDGLNDGGGAQSGGQEVEDIDVDDWGCSWE